MVSRACQEHFLNTEPELTPEWHLPPSVTPTQNKEGKERSKTLLFPRQRGSDLVAQIVDN